MRTFVTRFVMTFGVLVAVSFIISIIYMNGIIPDFSYAAGVYSALSLLIYMVIQYIDLKGFRFFAEKKIYFIINIINWLLLTVVCLIFALLDYVYEIEPVYTFLFCPFKVFYLFHLIDSKWLSAVCVSMILLAEIYLCSFQKESVEDYINRQNEDI